MLWETACFVEIICLNLALVHFREHLEADEFETNM